MGDSSLKVSSDFKNLISIVKYEILLRIIGQNEAYRIRGSVQQPPINVCIRKVEILALLKIR